MFLLEFGIEHRGCIVNELSRAMPHIRMICPGGFILDADTADEVIALDKPTDGDVQAVLGYLGDASTIAEVSLIERTPDRAFVHFLSPVAPEVGYCSKAVERNRCFRLGSEVQEGGVEKWRVGCKEHSYADGLVEELRGMGDLKYHNLREASWEELIAGPIA